MDQPVLQAMCCLASLCFLVLPVLCLLVCGGGKFLHLFFHGISVIDRLCFNDNKIALLSATSPLSVMVGTLKCSPQTHVLKVCFPTFGRWWELPELEPSWRTQLIGTYP